jgi:hypothetical protein
MKKRSLPKSAVTAVIGTFALLASTTIASAYVVCNDQGLCWHSDRSRYAPSLGLTIHPNDWQLVAGDHWREHRGFGYWHNGIWLHL